ncbi:MAG: DNA-3-methyladenine glycosylase [Candidatus Moraniibacteriota bacterium]
MQKLKKSFFERETTLVAKELLGQILVRHTEKGLISGIIVETEAYLGKEDLASHASRRKTARNQVMFGEAGFWYIYLIYGVYHCLNVVTEKKNLPGAVLIRALEPLEGLKEIKINRQTENIKNLTNGPGKLCQALKINKNLNQTPAFVRKSELFIAQSKISIPENKIKKAPRIGVDYAGIWKDKPLRFYIKDNPFVSKK